MLCSLYLAVSKTGSINAGLLLAIQRHLLVFIFIYLFIYIPSIHTGLDNHKDMELIICLMLS